MIWTVAASNARNSAATNRWDDWAHDGRAVDVNRLSEILMGVDPFASHRRQRGSPARRATDRPHPERVAPCAHARPPPRERSSREPSSSESATTFPASSSATHRPRNVRRVQPSLPEQPALSGLAPRGDCPLGSGVFVRCVQDASRWMRRAHVCRWCRDCRCTSGSATSGATDRRPSGHIPMRDADQGARSTPARNLVHGWSQTRPRVTASSAPPTRRTHSPCG